MIKLTREIDLIDFEGWAGANKILEEIQDAGKLEEFEDFILEAYPEGLSETTLNDILRFEALDILDMNDEEED